MLVRNERLHEHIVFIIRFTVTKNIKYCLLKSTKNVSTDENGGTRLVVYVFFTSLQTTTM